MSRIRRGTGRPVKAGVDEDLEAQADALIYAETRAAVHSEKRDILTPWKEQNRKGHEVLMPQVVDASTRQGTFTRAYNPVQRHLNSVEGVAGLRPRGVRPQHAHMVEYGHDPQSARANYSTRP